METDKLIRPISFLLGKWVSTNGSGKFPTIKPFSYHETVEFQQCGNQPNIFFCATTISPESGDMMHIERGVLKSKEGNNLSLMVAHNFGCTTLEEGTVEGTEIKLKSKGIVRMTDCPGADILEVVRTFSLKDEKTLIQKFYMRTVTTNELTEHLSATYTKQ